MRVGSYVVDLVARRPARSRSRAACRWSGTRSRILALSCSRDVADPPGGHQLEVLRGVPSGSPRSVREHPEPDLVVVVELVEGGDGGLLGEVELGGARVRVGDLAHRAGHVDEQQHPGRLALVLPVVEQLGEHLGARAPRAGSAAGPGRRRWSASMGLPSGDRRGCPGRKPNARIFSWFSGSPTKSTNRSAPGRLVVVHPVGVEHVERVVGVERALLRVDRHERHAAAVGAPRRPGARRRGCRGCSR